MKNSVFTNTTFRLSGALVLLLVGSVAALAQASPDRVWTAIDEAGLAEREISPSRYRTFRIDKGIIDSVLESAPEEFSGESRLMNPLLTLPMPDGKFERFHIEHSLVVEPELVAKYPELGRTYVGRGVDDPGATVRLDFVNGGFHAMVLSPRGTVMIDPYAAGDTDNYIVYFKRDVERSTDWACKFEEYEFVDKLLRPTEKTSDLIPDAVSPEVTSGTHLRTYRLALAGNWEYCNVAGGNTVAGCLSAMVTIMARVNGVYERDLAIRMVMIANNDLIAYAGDNTSCPVPTGGTACTNSNDPYANSSSALSQNTSNLNTVIGSANYDIGHVFTTGSGGVANLSVPCGANKGGGTTGLPSPFGDPFAIDFVAHEMGHQWGANHTFNASCGGNRSSGSAYEPGSGITIMGYAGVCGSQDLADHSIDTFHVKSLEVIVAFSQTGNGNTCATTSASGNTPPTVSVVGGPSWNIPKQTPFTLTATGSDPDAGDAVTYDWQEYDLGASTTGIPNSDADGQARPIVRPYEPTAIGSRTFPSPQYVRNNANVPPPTYDGGLLTGEMLPSITRTMTFQVVARDNHANAGGINTATATVLVDGNSGPLAVTGPNTAVTWTGNSVQTVTWNVANTTASPVSAANVRILFSSDGGFTFPTVISASTPNDGTESIIVPSIATSNARIKIEAVGNIFFDMSDVNFTVNDGPPTVKAPFDFDGDNRTDVSIFRPSNGQWWWYRSSDGQTHAAAFGTGTDGLIPADYTGDGIADLGLWRSSTGEWIILRSENFSFYSFPFGTAGDIPVPGDYDGDTKADNAVFRASSNLWVIQKSGGGIDFVTFGTTGDKPVMGDYDGDNKTDVAIFRPTTGEWWIRHSGSGNVVAYQFGNSSDRPVQGRYTADTKTDVAFWRPSTGEWFVLRSENISYYSVPFGASTDIPVPGDYDGDGRFDTSVFRPSSGNWFIDRTSAGSIALQFGFGTDKPVPNAYVP